MIVFSIEFSFDIFIMLFTILSLSKSSLFNLVICESVPPTAKLVKSVLVPSKIGTLAGSEFSSNTYPPRIYIYISPCIIY